MSVDLYGKPALRKTVEE